MRPSRVADRLVERHGRLRAIRKVGDRVDIYRRVEPDGEVRVTNPARWLAWTMTLALLLSVSHRELCDSLARHRPRLVTRSAA
jgi:hypothetical protein